MFFGTEAKIPEIKFAILDLTSLLLLPLPLQLRQPRRVLGLRAGGGVGLTAACAALARKRERHFEARSCSVSLVITIERHGERGTLEGTFLDGNKYVLTYRVSESIKGQVVCFSALFHCGKHAA